LLSQPTLEESHETLYRTNSANRNAPSPISSLIPPSLLTESSAIILSMSFTQITVQAGQMGGVPCIRSLRIPVATVVGMIADGMDEAEIHPAYPDLESEDVREAMRYAAEAVRERELPLAIPE
jgi:uncharacterized protein (DUF433 family)